MSGLELLRAKNALLAFELGLNGDIIDFVCGPCALQDASEITFVAGVKNYHPQLKGSIVIVENSIPRLRGFIDCAIGERALSQGVDVVFALGEMAYRELGWRYLFKTYQVIGEDPLIAEFMDGAAMCASEMSDFGANVYRNVWRNFVGVLESGQSLKGRLKGIPAVVCGAGPSLQEDLPQLAALSGRACIFGGGSSLEPLTRAGVEIHFGGTIDPKPPVSRMRGQSQFELPILYQLRASPDVLRQAHGRKIWCGTSEGIGLEKAIVGREFSVDGGWVVSNFLTAMAYYMGCDPIIAIGMDGCWSGENEYAGGVSETAAPHGEIITRDRDGNRVRTRRDLLWGAHWLSQFANERQDRTWINATRGGLALCGWQEKRISSVLFDVQHDLIGHIHSLQGEKISTDALLSDWNKAFYRVGSLCLELRDLLLENGGCYEGRALLLDLDLKDEVIYQALLKPLWAMFSHLIEDKTINSEIARLFFFLQVVEKYRRVDYH